MRQKGVRIAFVSRLIRGYVGDTAYDHISTVSMRTRENTKNSAADVSEGPKPYFIWCIWNIHETARLKACWSHFSLGPKSLKYDF
jgi:hypothetical protein